MTWDDLIEFWRSCAPWAVVEVEVNDTIHLASCGPGPGQGVGIRRADGMGYWYPGGRGWEQLDPLDVASHLDAWRWAPPGRRDQLAEWVIEVSSERRQAQEVAP